MFQSVGSNQGKELGHRIDSDIFSGFTVQLCAKVWSCFWFSTYVLN